MTPGEITESVLLQGQPVHDVVFMGQGEPLDNAEAVMDSVIALQDAKGPALSWRRITVSTVGLVPAIADELVGKLETFVRDEDSRGAVTNQARERLEKVLNALNRNRRGPS